MNTVIDASVLIMAFFDDEDGHVPAQRLIKDYADGKVDLFAPGLIVYEIVNACLIAVRTKRLKIDDARATIQAMLEIDIDKTDIVTIMDTVAELSVRFNISAYDACYLALAKVRGCIILTADKKLYNRVSPEISWIRLIQDYPFAKGAGAGL